MEDSLKLFESLLESIEREKRYGTKNLDTEILKTKKVIQEFQESNFFSLPTSPINLIKSHKTVVL